jgi:hypothetical protein
MKIGHFQNESSTKKSYNLTSFELLLKITGINMIYIPTHT